LTFTSPRLSGGCTGVSFNGGGSSATATADFAGGATMSVAGVNCSTGDYSIQVFGFYTSVDVPISLVI
jgi:hypothetical protein